MDATLKSMTTRIARLEEQFAERRAHGRDLAAKFTRLEHEVTQLEERIAAYRASLEWDEIQAEQSRLASAAALDWWYTPSPDRRTA